MRSLGAHLFFFPLVCLLAVGLASCGSDGGFPTPEPFDNPDPPPEDNPPTPPPPSPPPPAPPPAPTPPGTTSSQPIVPQGVTPPIGLTFNIGYTENVSMATLQGIYSKFVAVNTTLWNLTEGQVYIWKIDIRDMVGPGTTPGQWQANHGVINTSNLDFVVWPASSWNLGFTAGVTWWSSPPQFGRTGRLVLLPDNASSNTVTHELGHLIWRLSWPNSFGLDDEYLDGVQDPACLMESNKPPTRLCSPSNHVSQLAQPRSCWAQILIDYSRFAHTGADSASSAPWVPIVNYTDIP